MWSIILYFTFILQRYFSGVMRLARRAWRCGGLLGLPSAWLIFAGLNGIIILAQHRGFHRTYGYYDGECFR